LKTAILVGGHVATLRLDICLSLKNQGWSVVC